MALEDSELCSLFKMILKGRYHIVFGNVHVRSFQPSIFKKYIIELTCEKTMQNCYYIFMFYKKQATFCKFDKTILRQGF